MTGSPKKKTPVELLLDTGMADLQEAFAKADGDNGDLDDDFAQLDAARQASDAAREDDDTDGDDNAPPADDTPGDDDQGATDGDNTDDDQNAAPSAPPAKPGKSKPFAKAEEAGLEPVDAYPLLEALDTKLGTLLDAVMPRIEALEQQQGEIAKAVQPIASLVRGTLAIAKAVQGVADAPLPPKHLRGPAVVPTRTQVPQVDAGEVYAKAEAAMDAGRISARDISELNALVNEVGVEAALKQLPNVAKAISAEK